MAPEYPRTAVMALILVSMATGSSRAQLMTYGHRPDSHTVNLMVHSPSRSYQSPFLRPQNAYSIVGREDSAITPRDDSASLQTTECRFHGQYLVHPEEPCQYLLCTSGLYGVQASSMPCPPGMAAKAPRTKYSYPCTPDPARCPSLDSPGQDFGSLFWEDSSIPEAKEFPRAPQDHAAHTAYQQQPHPFPRQHLEDTPQADGTGPHYPAEDTPDYSRVPEYSTTNEVSEPTGTPIHLSNPLVRVREVIHGLQDDINHAVLEPYVYQTAPDPQPEVTLAQYPLDPEPQPEVPMEQYKLLPETQPEVHMSQFMGAPEPEQTERRVVRLEEPGMQMVLEETRRPGYQQLGKTVTRTNYARRPDGHGGDMMVEERHSKTSMTSSHESSVPTHERMRQTHSSQPRAQRPPQQRFAMSMLDSEQPRYAGQYMPLSSPLQLDFPREAERVIKRSFVHMPHIPASLRQMFERMRKRQ